MPSPEESVNGPGLRPLNRENACLNPSARSWLQSVKRLPEMSAQALRPKLIVIAGPNGSGKTTFTNQVLRHDWSDGCLFINPDNIARDEFGDWNSPDAVLKAVNRAKEIREECLREGKSMVDRAYTYDNSVDDRDPKKLFRMRDGRIVKTYADLKLHRWGRMLFDSLTATLPNDGIV